MNKFEYHGRKHIPTRKLNGGIEPYQDVYGYVWANTEKEARQLIKPTIEVLQIFIVS